MNVINYMYTSSNKYALVSLSSQRRDATLPLLSSVVAMLAGEMEEAVIQSKACERATCGLLEGFVLVWDGHVLLLRV